MGFGLVHGEGKARGRLDEKAKLTGGALSETDGEKG